MNLKPQNSLLNRSFILVTPFQEKINVMPSSLDIKAPTYDDLTGAWQHQLMDLFHRHNCFIKKRGGI